MTDSATTRNRFRKQEVGTNNNTWGTNLNEVLDCVDQVVDGVEAIDLASSTSYTLTTTDYTTADQAKNRVLVCSNVNAAGSDLIVPSVEHVYGVRNSGSATLTVKTSAGTGVAIPASRFAWVYCDATNVVSGVGTTLPSSYTPSLSTDVANVNYVDTAIANASVPASAGTLLVSGGDTTAGYLGAKVTIGFSTPTTTQISGLLSVTTEIENSGADENLRFLFTPLHVAGYLDGGRKDGPFTVIGGYAYSVVSGCTFYLESSPSDAAKARIALFNPSAAYFMDPNGNKVNNNTTALPIDGGQTLEITYDATLGDWE